MIATRLSSVRLVAGVAGAALCCYLLSQWVAGERAALARVDRDIVREQDMIGRLTTEITTRSRLTQIENWNRQLALQAPRPGQYVDSGFQLASLYAHDTKPQLAIDPAAVPNQGPIQQAAYPAPTPMPGVAAPAPAAPAITRAAIAPAPAPANPIRTVAFHVAVKPAAKPIAGEVPLLHTAAFVHAKSSRLDDKGDTVIHPANLLPASLLSSDIAGLAKAEQAKRAPRKGDVHAPGARNTDE